MTPEPVTLKDASKAGQIVRACLLKGGGRPHDTGAMEYALRSPTRSLTLCLLDKLQKARDLDGTDKEAVTSPGESAWDAVIAMVQKTSSKGVVDEISLAAIAAVASEYFMRDAQGNRSDEYRQYTDQERETLGLDRLDAACDIFTKWIEQAECDDLAVLPDYAPDWQIGGLILRYTPLARGDAAAFLMEYVASTPGAECDALWDNPAFDEKGYQALGEMIVNDWIQHPGFTENYMNKCGDRYFLAGHQRGWKLRENLVEEMTAIIEGNGARKAAATLAKTHEIGSQERFAELLLEDGPPLGADAYAHAMRYATGELWARLAQKGIGEIGATTTLEWEYDLSSEIERAAMEGIEGLRQEHLIDFLRHKDPQIREAGIKIARRIHLSALAKNVDATATWPIGTRRKF